MARKEVENLKLMSAEDKQIFDLLLKHQVNSGWTIWDGYWGV